MHIIHYSTFFLLFLKSFKHLKNPRKKGIDHIQKIFSWKTEIVALELLHFAAAEDLPQNLYSKHTNLQALLWRAV